MYTAFVPKASDRNITVDGSTLRVLIERKRVKNVNARLRGSTLRVSAPRGMSEEAIEPLVIELARKLLRRMHQSMVNEEEDTLALARKVASRFHNPPAVDKVLFVTTQRARWGSYSPRANTIRLNVVLRRMPRWVLEAVVAHELAHFFHRDHSSAFRDLLRRVCPESDRAEAFLAGVSWFAHNRERLPAVERELLGGLDECPEGHSSSG